MRSSTDPSRAAVTCGVPLVLQLALTGCAAGPREADLLPDEGPTTLEVYERHLGGVAAGAAGDTGRPEPSAAEPAGGTPPPALRLGWSGERVAPAAEAATRGGHQALGALHRDFQRVPNPEILGYVYPHRAGELPVPGYFTVFPLREGIHYAEPGEGDYIVVEAAP